MHSRFTKYLATPAIKCIVGYDYAGIRIELGQGSRRAGAACRTTRATWTAENIQHHIQQYSARC